MGKMVMGFLFYFYAVAPGLNPSQDSTDVRKILRLKVEIDLMIGAENDLLIFTSHLGIIISGKQNLRVASFVPACKILCGGRISEGFL